MITAVLANPCVQFSNSFPATLSDPHRPHSGRASLNPSLNTRPKLRPTRPLRLSEPQDHAKSPRERRHRRNIHTLSDCFPLSRIHEMPILILIPKPKLQRVACRLRAPRVHSLWWEAIFPQGHLPQISKLLWRRGLDRCLAAVSSVTRHPSRQRSPMQRRKLRRTQSQTLTTNG